MLLQRTDSLPDSTQWLYELKLDGYRAIAYKRDGMSICGHATTMISADVTRGVVKGLAKMPDNTVIDGEVIAFDDDGRSRLTLFRTTVRRPLRSFTTCST
jgi:bifunctional non-homologous end joining protein LigD